jgi:hypothetical protein
LENSDSERAGLSGSAGTANGGGDLGESCCERSEETGNSDNQSASNQSAEDRVLDGRNALLVPSDVARLFEEFPQHDVTS